MRAKEASKYIGVGLSTIWLYAKQGKITAYKISDRVTIFKKDNLDRFINANTEEAQMKKSTHIITIMKLLLAGKKVVSEDSLASNSNQYFGTIKKHGVELVEVWKPNITNSGRHKERSLHQTLENIDRAKKYLEALQEKIPNERL